MRHQPWSEPLQHRPEEPEHDAELEPDSARGRPMAVSAMALIAAALIVVIIAAVM